MQGELYRAAAPLLRAATPGAPSNVCVCTLRSVSLVPARSQRLQRVHSGAIAAIGFDFLVAIGHD